MSKACRPMARGRRSKRVFVSGGHFFTILRNWFSTLISPRGEGKAIGLRMAVCLPTHRYSHLETGVSPVSWSDLMNNICLWNGENIDDQNKMYVTKQL